MKSFDRQNQSLRVSNLGDRIAAVLAKEQADKGFSLESKSESVLRFPPTCAARLYFPSGLSMLAIILYLGLRFDFQFGLAATVATFHDVLIVLGICWLMDMEMTPADYHRPAHPGRLLPQRHRRHL